MCVCFIRTSVCFCEVDVVAGVRVTMCVCVHMLQRLICFRDFFVVDSSLYLNRKAFCC